MLNATDFEHLAKLGAINVRLRLGKVRRASLADTKLVVVGHSAAGKSAALLELGLDRNSLDMDVFCRTSDVQPNLKTLVTMADSAPAPIVVCSNHERLFDELIARRDSEECSNLIFIYFKRPLSALSEHLTKVNTDGHRHPESVVNNYSILYASFDRRYANLSDIQVDYDGNSIVQIAAILRLMINRFTTAWLTERGDAWTPASASKVEPLNQEEQFYQEYLSLLALSSRDRASIQPLSPSEMRSITAGGYQSFDANIFPPRAAPGSIALKKLEDLKWRQEEFEGRSVLEIGCQLGFFAFQAAALGARQCVGMDISKRFVHEANKIAVNYKTICNWEEDRVRFASAKVVPGQRLPIKPDIIVANSIVHWWIIQNEDISIYDILAWLSDSCIQGVYFEGCVSAIEPIMKQHAIPERRFNEELFLQACEKVFSDVKFVGRCSYDNHRIVCRLLNEKVAGAV